MVGFVEVGLKSVSLYYLFFFLVFIWIVVENYCFELVFYEVVVMVKSLGIMVFVMVMIDVLMMKFNKYFGCVWWRDLVLKGVFIFDCGVYFVVGLCVMMGCDIKFVIVIVMYWDVFVFVFDILIMFIKFDNGCLGVMVILYVVFVSKVCWCVICFKGMVIVECGLG